jgi:hypothetical protein
MVELSVVPILANNNMFLKDFYSIHDGSVSIVAEQASMFAKEVAHDFNPLHDVDAKRFCVPGDLLFSMALEKYGLSQNMHFNFSGMVGHDILLNFPDTDAELIDVSNNQGKTYLQVKRSGGLSRCPKITCTTLYQREDGVVPFTMKICLLDLDFFELLIGHLNSFWIKISVKFDLNFQPRPSGRSCDQIDDHFMAN